MIEIVAILFLFILLIILSNNLVGYYYNKQVSEPYAVDFRASNINKCARSCKETLNCAGFVLDPVNQCILFGRPVTDKDDLTRRDIICNKVQPISRFKYNSGISRLDKIKNAVYNCKSRSINAQLFSNGDRLKNITGLVNYGLNNTLIDYNLTDIGPLGVMFQTEDRPF